MAQRPLNGLHQQFNQLIVYDKDPTKHTFYYGDKNSYYYIPIFQQNSKISFGDSTYEIIKLKRRTETALIYLIRKQDKENQKILIEYQFIFDHTIENENYKYFRDDTNDDNDKIKFRHLCRIAKMRDEENQQVVQLIRFIQLNNQNQQNKIKLLDQLSKEQLQQIEYNQIYVDEKLNIQIRQRQQNVSCFVQAPVAISQIIPYQQTFLIGFYHSLLNNSTIFHYYLNREQNLQLYLKKSQAPLFLQQQIAGALKYNYKLQIPKNTLLKEIKQLDNQKLQDEQQQKVKENKQVDLKIQENQQQLNEKEKTEQQQQQSILSDMTPVFQGEGYQEQDNKQQLSRLDIIRELLISIQFYTIQCYSRNNNYNKSPFFTNDYTDYLKKQVSKKKNPMEQYEEFPKIKTIDKQYLTDCHLKLLENNINFYLNYITLINKIDKSIKITKYEHLLREKITGMQDIVGEAMDLKKKIADYSNQKELEQQPRDKAHTQLLSAVGELSYRFKEALHVIVLITLGLSESTFLPILKKALDKAVGLAEHIIVQVCSSVLYSLDEIKIDKNATTVGLQEVELSLITQAEQNVKKGIETTTKESSQELNASVEYRNMNTNNYNRKPDSSNLRELLKFINSVLLDSYLNIQPGDIDNIDAEKYICKMKEVFGDQFVSEFNKLLQQLQNRHFSEVNQPYHRISTETKEFNKFIPNSAAVKTNDDSNNLNNIKQLIEQDNLKLFEPNSIIDNNGAFEKQIKIENQQIKGQHTEITKIQFKYQKTKNEIPSKPEVKQRHKETSSKKIKNNTQKKFDTCKTGLNGKYQ